MLGTAVALGTLGGLAKLYSGTYKGEIESLKTCPGITSGAAVLNNLDPTTGRIYAHFTGTVHSDKDNVIKDSESGMEFSVVAMRKRLVEILEVRKGTTSFRAETVLSDTGNQFFGNLYLKSKFQTKKSDFDDGVRHVECVMSPEVQRNIPLLPVFSNYRAVSGGVVVHNNINNNINESKPRANENESNLSDDDRRAAAASSSSSTTTTTRNIIGTRMDISATKTGSQLTIIGEFTGDEKKGKWVAVKGISTTKNFEDYRDDVSRTADTVNLVGNVLLGVSALCGVTDLIHKSNENFAR